MFFIRSSNGRGSEMKIGITGATGFIGQKLSAYLFERGHDVIGLVRNPNAVESPLQGIEIRQCDITERDTLEDVLQGMDVVIHLAALFNRPGETWEAYQKTNVDGTRNVLEVAAANHVGRVIHCSTGGVVAGGTQMPFSETSPYATPDWDKYETTKRQAEEFASAFSQEAKTEVVILRPTQPYGPGDSGKAKFYRLIKKGIIVNPGKTFKHPIYIDDLCQAFELAASKPQAKGHIFNIGGAEPILLRDLIKIVAEALNVGVPKIVLPSTPVTLMCRWVEATCNLVRVKPPVFRRSMDFFTKSVAFEVSKAKEILGFTANTDLHDGVRQTATWYRENGMIQ